MITKKNSISTCSPKPKPAAAAATSSWPLPSLRLVIVCVSLAVTLTMSAMIIFVDVRAPSLADIFLSTMYFPLGQGLQLKARRWSNNKTECLHFFKTRDENFRRFDGLQCGHAFWQSTANVEEKDRYVKKSPQTTDCLRGNHSQANILPNIGTKNSKIRYQQVFITKRLKMLPRRGMNFEHSDGIRSCLYQQKYRQLLRGQVNGFIGQVQLLGILSTFSGTKKILPGG